MIVLANHVDVVSDPHSRRVDEAESSIGEIRHANNQNDFNLVRELDEYLALALAESPEHLLKTRELADCKFSAKNKQRNELANPFELTCRMWVRRQTTRPLAGPRGRSADRSRLVT